MSDKRATEQLNTRHGFGELFLIIYRVGRTGLQPTTRLPLDPRGKTAPSDFELLQNPFLMGVDETPGTVLS